ncbi:hypothetical protein ACJJTC_017456 [Scirpophaga incertulas]
MQKLVQDHRKRLKVLYEYVADKLKGDKIKVREKRGGEEVPEIKEGDKIFMKTTRIRKAKQSWLVFLALMKQNHSLELRNMNTNPGIVPLKVGVAAMRNNSWTILKILDLDFIVDQFNNNIEKYDTIRKIISNDNELESLKYKSAISPCEEIENGKFICSKNNIVEYREETCIEQIMLDEK